MTYKFRVFTGPCDVDEVARRLTLKGIDAQAGTQHVSGRIHADSDLQAEDKLNAAAGFRVCRLPHDTLEEVR